MPTPLTPRLYERGPGDLVIVLAQQEQDGFRDRFRVRLGSEWGGEAKNDEVPTKSLFSRRFVPRQKDWYEEDPS